MLLVMMSLEKCFAVYFPFKSKTVCTVRTAKWSTGIVRLILAGYDSIYFVATKSHFIKASGMHVCVYNLDLFKTLSTVDSVLYSFGPFILMFVTNFAIVFKFMRAKCKNNSTESINQALVKAATRGTVMVVTVSVTFLILTEPTAVEQALSHVIRLGSNQVYRVCMNITQYLNHSINGVLYIIVGTRFRNEFLRIFRRRERSDSRSVSHSLNNLSLTTMSGTRF